MAEYFENKIYDFQKVVDLNKLITSYKNWTETSTFSGDQKSR